MVVDGEIVLIFSGEQCVEIFFENLCLFIELCIVGEWFVKVNVVVLFFSLMDGLICFVVEDLVCVFDGYLLVLFFYDGEEIDCVVEEIECMLWFGLIGDIVYDYCEDDVWVYNFWGQILRWQNL